MKLLPKIAVAVVAVAGLGFLFMRSVRQSRAAPYTVARADLAGGLLAVEPASSGADPVLLLRPSPGLVRALSDQIFKRAMESLQGPAVLGIPLVLKGEVDRAFGGQLPPEALLAAARGAGLDSAPLVPRCLAYRRVSDQGSTRQLWFVLFDAPAFARFREQVARLGNSTGVFDPAALSAVLPVATSGPPFGGWLPLQADPARDCVAPIVIGAAGPR